MFFNKIFKYEVLGWRNAANPQQPDEMDLFDTQREARNYAVELNRRNERVEINRIEIDADDENNWLGDTLVAVYEFGIKTA